MSAERVPTLWMVAALAALCCAGTSAAWWRDWSARRRARALLGRPGSSGESAPRRPAPAGRRPVWLRAAPVREAVLALGVVAFGAVIVGGTSGWLAGGAGACAAWWWLRRRRDESGRGEAAGTRAVAGQLPLTADLMAACLAAGSGPGGAAEAVGASVGDPLGARLLSAATELRLGGEPSAVWGRFGELPGCETLARCMERAGTAGVPAVESVTRFANESRARTSRTAAARARRAGVLVTAPLGLCFLPAFLAVGVAPVVLGLARSLL